MVLKKLLNTHEGQTKKLLGAAAENNGAEVFSKIRIADVLPIEGSGINGDFYRYALQAHFDFVVVDGEHTPLFVVEYDGPGHTGPRSADRDRKKELLCKTFDLPLARVRDEHIFRQIRGVDYVTWLTEVFFVFQALVEAQSKGIIPYDEPLDPMLIMSSPYLKGRFPLWLAADARVKLVKLRKDKSMLKGYPSEIGSYPADPDAHEGACIVVGSTRSGDMLIATNSIYLRGFGIGPSEAANEIAIVSFVNFLEEYEKTGIEAVPPERGRDTVIRFLRQYPVLGHMSGQSGSEAMPFSLRYEGKVWRVGPLRGEPEVVIPIPNRSGDG